MGTGKKRGRPRKLQDAALLNTKIDQYFLDPLNAVPTISGLTLWLGFDDRDGLVRYLHRVDTTPEERELSRSIKRALSRIERSWEEQLRGKAYGGAIFWLKQRPGWTDEQHVDLTTQGDKITGFSVEFSQPTTTSA